jgi:Putative Ig domain
VTAPGHDRYPSGARARIGGAPSCGAPLPAPVFPPSIVAQSLPDAALGHPYTATLSATDGRTPYRWKLLSKLGKLPRGIKLNTTTGIISGTPMSSGTPKKLTGTRADRSRDGRRCAR